MKVKLSVLSIVLLFLAACSKSVDTVSSNSSFHNAAVNQKASTTLSAKDFVEYRILQGQQFCDKSIYQMVKYDSLSFIVKFDSSAIYQTTSKGNQDDINKLFGFSDNNAQHQQYSARFGWRWSNNALRIFGYVYNNGVRSFKDLGIVDIGKDNYCSIKVSGKTYIFNLNGKSSTMSRESTTEKAEGYKLFPYFGGDEAAPHTILIWIKELI